MGSVRSARALLALCVVLASCTSSAWSSLPAEDQEVFQRCMRVVARAQCPTYSLNDVVGSNVCYTDLGNRYAEVDTSENRRRWLLQQGCPESMVRTSMATETPQDPALSMPESRFVAFDPTGLTGRDFHCSGDDRGGRCYPSMGACESGRSARVDVGQDPGAPCRPRDTVTCFSAQNARSGAVEVACFHQPFPANSCQVARASIMQRNRQTVVYRRLSQCAEVRAERGVGDAGTPVGDAAPDAG